MFLPSPLIKSARCPRCYLPVPVFYYRTWKSLQERTERNTNMNTKRNKWWGGKKSNKVSAPLMWWWGGRPLLSFRVIWLESPKASTSFICLPIGAREEGRRGRKTGSEGTGWEEAGSGEEVGGGRWAGKGKIWKRGMKGNGKKKLGREEGWGYRGWYRGWRSRKKGGRGMEKGRERDYGGWREERVEKREDGGGEER